MNLNFLKNKNLLITGGTGSLGNALIEYVIRKKGSLKRLIVFSRDEYKQSEMQKKFPEKKYEFLRYFLGDVRDINRLNLAFRSVDYVIHAAALKQVPFAEYNPLEFVNTNILGSNNVINASINNNIKKIVALSTDKASSPINLYGATKLCSDKLFLAANNISTNKGSKFSVVRYGNVSGSRGSVIPIFIELHKRNKNFTVTDQNMTRFSISLEESVKAILWTLKNSDGREIIIPKLKSYNILDIAKAIDPKRKIKIIGLRPGEKIHEELISTHDSVNTFDYGDYYAIRSIDYNLKKKKIKKLKKVKKNFSFTSNKPVRFLKLSEIKKIIDSLKNN
tara:strand:- start:205 stop:1209 length:1005 start_codon:yes stop_codon:yes gene_type:complete